MSLNDRQVRFVQEYLVDLNATQAAIRAGYSQDAAGQLGHKLVKKGEIKTAIAEAMNDRAIRTGVTQDFVVAQLARLARANMADFITIQKDGSAYVDLSALTRDQATAITEFTVEEFTDGSGDDAREVKRTKVKLADKVTPLIQLGRHLGMFGGKDFVGVSVTVNITPTDAKL